MSASKSSLLPPSVILKGEGTRDPADWVSPRLKSDILNFGYDYFFMTFFRDLSKLCYIYLFTYYHNKDEFVHLYRLEDLML